MKRKVRESFERTITGWGIGTNKIKVFIFLFTIDKYILIFYVTSVLFMLPPKNFST